MLHYAVHRSANAALGAHQGASSARPPVRAAEGARIGSHLALLNRCWTRDNDDDRRTTTMKKRAVESDVRAMAAAFAERGTGKPEDARGGMSLDAGVHFSIRGLDGKIFEDSLAAGARLKANIRFTSSAKTNSLYVGGVDLVDTESSTPIPLYTTAQAFSGNPIDFDLLALPGLTTEGPYTFKLRYSLGAVPALEDLSTAIAEDDRGEEQTFTASSVASGVPGTKPTETSSTSTSTLTDEQDQTFIPKPTTVSQVASIGTPTATPDSATGNSSGKAPASSPSPGLSTGAKAGIGVGVAAAVLIIIALVVAWWLRRSRRASSRNGGVGEKESVLAAGASGGGGEYRDADEAGAAIVGGSPITRKPIGAPVSNDAALAGAVSPASTTVGVVGGQSRGAGGPVASQESMLNAEERERWEEEERRLDEDIAEAERRRLGA
ncbi:hypothetical protein V494_03243 [Pseudogymnoascus sp. VKM F-4513 (FW-928)]|nr:hypothetical protein V494_03243 [Pseudogymnoascus sp. VKM F-4513 (FW-928)]